MTRTDEPPTCGWTTYNWLFDETSKCENPATRIVTTGCRHEHVAPCPTCDSCFALTEKRIEGLRCTPCRDAGHPDVRVVIAADEPLAVAP